MSEVKLSWATADVEDGKLTVELEGEIPSGWKQSFETTAKLLGHGDWGMVRIKKHEVRVSEVAPGDEERLRHHLESIVEQANAALRPPEAESERAGGESDDDTPDAQMTKRFRAFDEESERHEAQTPAE